MKKRYQFIFPVLFLLGSGQTHFSMAAQPISSTPLLSQPSLPLSTEQIQRLHQLLPLSENSPSVESSSSVSEHIVWDKTPINVVLPVDKERMLTFPDSIEFGYDTQTLASNVLRVQNANGTLYLLAKATFPVQRVLVKIIKSGEVVLLNLSALEKAENTPITIVLPHDTKEARIIGESIPPPHASEEQIPNDTVSYTTLMRFAVHQLYAPRRLLMQPKNIYRTPMHTQKTVPLFRDGSVLAMPLASWRADTLTITAVLLRNQLHQTVTLDPRTVCGSWQAVSFFPRNTIAPAGTRDDSTTAFVIAQQSLGEIVHACIHGVS